MSMKIKVIGIQRSGTNYISTLLEDNFHVNSIDTGIGRKPGDPREYFWKHSYNPDQYEQNTDNSPEVVKSGITNLKKDKIPTILITKNPYFWLESVKRVPGDIGKKNITFVKWRNLIWKGSKPTIRLLDLEVFDLESVCKMWNDYHSFWIENKFENLHTLRYEDLISQVDKEIDIISTKFNLETKAQKIKIPKKVHMSQDFDAKRIQRSIDQKSPNISEEEKKIMTSTLSTEVLEFYNYKIL